MKNIIVHTYKLAIIATSLVMVYFAAGIASIAQASELLKAEPIKHEAFISQAQDNLALTFSTVSIAPITIQNNAKSMIAMEKNDLSESKEVTLSKTMLVSE